jgi:hypothetical protein
MHAPFKLQSMSDPQAAPPRAAAKLSTLTTKTANILYVLWPPIGRARSRCPDLSARARQTIYPSVEPSPGTLLDATEVEVFAV